MKRLIWSIVVPLALAAGWLSLPTPRAVGENVDEFPERDFVVRAARVFTGESLLAPGVVVVRAGKIEQVGETADVPEGLPVLDLGDRTLLPGLIDAHVHVFGTGAGDALNFGVTTVLDQVNDPGQIAELKRAAKGAQVFSAGMPATAPGGHGTQYGFEVPAIEGPDDAAGFVEQISAAGSDWMKIIIEPRMATLDEATVHALAAEARNRDMLAVAHVSRQEHARWAHEAGVDGLVHIFRDEPADPELAAAMAASGMDEMAGGNSTVTMTSKAEDELAFIRLTGETAAGFVWPWSGAMVFPGEFPMAAADLSNFTRLVFMARGDIDSLNVMAFSPSLGEMPAIHSVPLGDDWQEISVELETFAGAEAAAIQGFSFAAGMPARPFEFDLAEVRLE